MSLTKQDVQSCIDIARMRMMATVPSRQDVQILKDTTRNLVTLLNQSQQYMNQSQRQRTELIRRSVSLEARIAQLEHQLQEVHRIVNAVSNQRSQETITQRAVSTNGEEQQERVQYGYTPIAYSQQ